MSTIVKWPAGKIDGFAEFEEFELDTNGQEGRLDVYLIKTAEEPTSKYWFNIGKLGKRQFVEPGVCAWEFKLLASVNISAGGGAGEEGHTGSSEPSIEYVHPAVQMEIVTESAKED